MIREIKGQFGVISKENTRRANKYIVLTGNDIVDYASIIQLEMLRENLKKVPKNDILKYNLPECWKVSLVSSFNVRSLQNFLSLRSKKEALWEIRQLANEIFKALPEEHKYLFKECMK